MPISEVYLMDCLTKMKEFKDNEFDLCIADPNYGIGIANAKEIGYKGFNTFTPKEWDNTIPSQDYFTEMLRVSKNQIIWGGNYFTDFLQPSRCWIIWDKGEGFYGRTYAECEMAWTSFDANAKIFKRDPLAKGDYKGKIHITQKPAALYYWTLNNYAKLGDKILDPFLGSGSSRIAAYKLGFDFVGIENDPQYFEAMDKRFKESISLPLFDSIQPKQLTIL